MFVQIYKEAAGKIKPEMLKETLQQGKHLCEIAGKIGDSWKNKSYLFELEDSYVEDIINGKDHNNPERQRL